MPKYRFMYDTGISVVFPFEDDEMAKAFVDASPDNLMFYYKENDDAQ